MGEQLTLKEDLPEQLREAVAKKVLELPATHMIEDVGPSYVSFMKNYLEAFGEDYDGAIELFDSINPIHNSCYTEYSPLQYLILDYHYNELFEDPDSLQGHLDDIKLIATTADKRHPRIMWPVEYFGSVIQSRTGYKFLHDKLDVIVNGINEKPGVNSKRILRLNKFLYEELLDWKHTSDLPSKEWFDEWVSGYLHLADGRTRLNFMQNLWYNRGSLDEIEVRYLNKHVNALSTKKYFVGFHAVKFGVDMYKATGDAEPVVEIFDTAVDIAQYNWRLAGSFLQAHHTKITAPDKYVSGSLDHIDAEAGIVDADTAFSVVEKHGGSPQWKRLDDAPWVTDHIDIMYLEKEQRYTSKMNKYGWLV